MLHEIPVSCFVGSRVMPIMLCGMGLGFRFQGSHVGHVARLLCLCWMWLVML